MDIVCERIKMLREEEGLSAAQLSKKLGISQSAMSYYESGKRVPDIALVRKYADYFGCTAGYVLGLESSKRQSELNMTTEAVKSLETVLSSTSPRFRRELIIIISELADTLVFIKNIWDEEELEKSLSIYKEFVVTYDELHKRLAEFPHYDFNEAPASAVLEHCLSIEDCYEDFTKIINKIMNFAKSRRRQNDADVN